MAVTSSDILKSLARQINSLSSPNKVVRRKALEQIKNETVNLNPPLEKDQLQIVVSEMHRNVILCLSDESEKCREIALSIIADFLNMAPSPLIVLSSFMPVLVQRLGQQEVVEESEELRLSMIKTLCLIIDLANENVVQFLNDYIKILQQTITDPFADVKKESCKCASSLAKTIPAYFHQHSENLVNPLLTQISHQHSKVRVAVITCLGDVIRFGNNKSVDDVISHFAQRVFDQTPAVRLALTNVIGDWMLNLPDRYSFWHKMIPLLLSAVDDTQHEVSTKAADFWKKAGKQFEEENEQDLKDKLDFSIEMPAWYPEDIERPCIGCRVLIYRNFGKFIHGIQNDITDWVAETRVKTASLLYQCLLNVEDSVTQFLSKVFIALQKGALDEEKTVIGYIEKSSELIGYFVNPESWLEILLPVIKSAQTPAGLLIAASIIKGSQPDILKHYVEQLIEVVHADDVCRSFQQSRYLQGLQSVVYEVCRNQISDILPYRQQLFNVSITSIALSLDQETAKKGHNCLEIVAQSLQSDLTQLYVECMPLLLRKLSDKSKVMSSMSCEFLIFETLVLSAGTSVGVAVPEVMDMFALYLNPEKEPELRLKFLSVLCKLVLSANSTLNSSGELCKHSVSLVREVLLPNLVWKAGRTNAATRTSCITALWAVLEGEFISNQELTSLITEMMPCLTSMLDEDNTTGRVITTKCLKKILNAANIDPDMIHKLIPELIKRLDDRENSVRFGTTEVFLALIDALPMSYDSGLYKAHCDSLYEGLLVHLDDSDQEIQNAVFQVLKKSIRLCPSSLKDAINAVKHKHRTPMYCDKLLELICSESGSGDLGS